MISSLDECVDAILERYGSSIKRINLSSNGLQDIQAINKISPVLETVNLSDNDIQDIGPLSRVASLTDINLASNNIGDISALSALSSLRKLDLRNNQISSVLSLQPLSQLKNLNELYLEGNPCSSSLATFPKKVFTMLPCLNILDQWNRSAFQELIDTESLPTVNVGVSDISEQSGLTLPDATACNSLSTHSEVEALRAQLQAMETAFTLQERSLSSDGLSAAQDDSLPHESNIHSALKSFPYTRLLRLWRTAAIENIYSRIVLDNQLAAQNKSLKALRNEGKQSQLQHEAIVIGLKERLSASQKSVEALQSQAEALFRELNDSTKQKLASDSRVQLFQKSFNGMWSSVQMLQKKAEESMFQQQVTVNQALQEIKTLEDRLLAATKRVQFAVALTAQKEISLRNSAAALEAERLLLSRQFVEGQTSNQSDDQHKLSDVDISAEAEALLAGLFRHLDPGDIGEVDSDLLLEALLLSSDSTEGQSPSEASIGDIIRQELGNDLYSRLVDSLASQSQAKTTITWGEFLLLLVPSPRSNVPSSGIPSKGVNDDLSPGLLNDRDWSIIPLQLPSEKSSMAAKSAPSDEVARLTKERSFLLKRIQEMNKNLNRRAEGIRGFYASQITTSELLVTRLKHQINDQESTILTLQQRAELLEQQTRDKSDEYRNRISALEQEVRSLQEQLQRRHNSDVESYEELLAKEKTRFSRLDTEHQLLLRDNSKKEVRLKGFQRDVVRLQASLLAAVEEKDRLAARCEEYSRMPQTKDFEAQTDVTPIEMPVPKSSVSTSVQCSIPEVSAPKEISIEHQQAEPTSEQHIYSHRLPPRHHIAEDYIRNKPLTVLEKTQYTSPANEAKSDKTSSQSANLESMEMNLQRLLRLAEQIVSQESEGQPSRKTIFK